MSTRAISKSRSVTRKTKSRHAVKHDGPRPGTPRTFPYGQGFVRPGREIKVLHSLGNRVNVVRPYPPWDLRLDGRGQSDYPRTWRQTRSYVTFTPIQGHGLVRRS
jgi:hypothetical protein